MNFTASLIVVLITTAVFSCTVAADEKLIEATCRKTLNYQLCVSTLKGSRATDVKGLALDLVSAVRGKANEAVAAINELKHGAKGELAAALNKCTDLYRTVIGKDIGDATRGVQSGNALLADNALHNTAIGANACEAAVGTAVAGKPSPLKRQNMAVNDLAVVAGAVSRTLN